MTAPAIPPSAPVSLKWTNTLGRIRAAAASASASNPLINGLASGVTVSVSGTNDTSLTTILSGAGMMSNVSPAGGSPYYRTATSSWYFPVANVQPSTGNISAVGGPGGSSASAWGWSVSMETFAARVQINVVALTSTGYGFRVLVDGKYVSMTATAYVVNGGTNYIIIDFSGVVARRTITFETAQNNSLQKICTPATYPVARAPSRGTDLIDLYTGDSFGEGTGSSCPGIIAWPRMFGQLTGARDVRQVCVGATGYFASGSTPGTRQTIRQQIPYWATTNPDINMANVDRVVFAGGVNDTGQTTAAITAEALLCYQLARTVCPNALFIIFGSWCGSLGSADAGTLAVEAGIAAAWAAWGDTHSMYLPVTTDTPAWIDGTGYIGATNGTGNSDYCTNPAPDKLHPVDIGHLTIAGRGAGSYLAQLRYLPNA